MTHELYDVVLLGTGPAELKAAIHAAAALKHRYIDRDRTLVRMISGK